jgi:hypothetical protein
MIVMALGVMDRGTIQDVAELADTYADQVIADLPTVESTESLRDGLAGAFLVFLRDAVLLTNSRRE